MRSAGGNSGLGKVVVQCSLPVPVQAGADTFVVNHPPAGGFQITFFGKSRALRVAANR